MTIPTFDNPETSRRLAEWLGEPYDQATRAELCALVESGKNSELEDRFYKTLEFGTGGLRGKLGAGTNRMNAYVVARATQGLANYVKAHAEKQGPLRAAITHDSRHRSREFAEVSAEVLAANGFYVHISAELRPTPYLSYAVRKLGCHTGIVITASHNPKEYNGYKCYWDDGSQVVPPHDDGIIDEVAKVVSEEQVKRLRFDDGVAQGIIKIMGREMDDDFLAAVLKQRRDAGVIQKHAPRVVYTPLHGVGGTLAPRALAMWGFRDVICEPDQMIPNGDFPTAASPNPEEGAALDRSIQLARKEDADLVLATDPDADRLGIAVRHGGDFQLMTGNQVCALIAEHVFSHAKNPASGRRPGMVTTIVTSPLVAKVAEFHGAACPLVLTGFKWIAAVARDWESAPGNPEFLYGTEESYGYLVGDHCRDKDGIVAACVVAEMAAQARSRGMTLVDCLYDLYQVHGVHFEWQKNITLPGIEGARQIKAMLDGIRTNPPAEICGRKVVRFSRLDTGEIIENGRPAGRMDLPSSDVFVFDLADGSRAIVRPSGTEPKIKFYFFLCRKGVEREAIPAMIGELKTQVPAFEKGFLQSIGYTVQA